MKFSVISLSLPKRNTSFDEIPTGWKPIDYFIVKGKGDYIAYSIKEFCYGSLVDDLTYYIVYLDTGGNNVNKENERVLGNLWTQQGNMIVLARNKEGNIGIYSWFPFRNSSRMKILDHCDGQRLG